MVTLPPLRVRAGVRCPRSGPGARKWLGQAVRGRTRASALAGGWDRVSAAVARRVSGRGQPGAAGPSQACKLRPNRGQPEQAFTQSDGDILGQPPGVDRGMDRRPRKSQSHVCSHGTNAGHHCRSSARCERACFF